MQDVGLVAIELNRQQVSRLGRCQMRHAGAAGCSQRLKEEAFSAEHAPESAEQAALHLAFHVDGGVHGHHGVGLGLEGLAGLEMNLQQGEGTPIEHPESEIFKSLQV